MGVRQEVEITCDFSGCKVNAGKPYTVRYNPDLVNTGTEPKPEGVEEGVLLTCNGRQYFFCRRLHAAAFFLPEGCDIVEGKVMGLKSLGVPEGPKPVKKNWKDEPPRSEGPVEQADGSPEGA